MLFVRTAVLGLALLTMGAAAQQTPAETPAQTAPPQTHAVAFQYPPGYAGRLKIHKIASFATLPLFATEVILGNKLYNNPDQPGVKSAHGAVSTAIVGLFAVNTVTGIWNLKQSQANPDGRRLRWIHSIAMLAADAGFAATAMSGPKIHNGVESPDFQSQRAHHRDLAYASVGVGTFGYVIMLFRHK